MNIKLTATFALALAFTGVVNAATVTFLSNIGIAYVYDYRCNNGSSGKLQIVSANRAQADGLADLEAASKCGE